MARKQRRRNSRPDVYLACAVILCAPCLLLWVLISRGLGRVVPAPGMARTAHRRDTAPVGPAVILTPLRAIYPHSVIPGGAYSVAELQAALRVDPVAAAHYAVFDRSQLRVSRASDSAAVYVSYRQGNRVYWTRRKLHLAAEERLLTDGVHAARSRCGNRISLTPQEPTAANEPSGLDLPEPPPVAGPTDLADAAGLDDGSAAEPMNPFPLPMMVVPEIFPGLLGNAMLASLPGEVPGGGGPMLTLAPGGVRFSGPRQVSPPLLSGLTLPPPPGVWPVHFHTMPPEPVGPGFLGIPPIPLPGGDGAGGTSGAPPKERVPTVPAILGLPTVPGGLPFPGPSAENVLLSPGLTLPQAEPAAGPSGTKLPALPASGPTWQAPLPPNDPLPFAPGIPEPATSALLLCGALVLAFRRFSRRRPD